MKSSIDAPATPTTSLTRGHNRSMTTPESPLSERLTSPTRDFETIKGIAEQLAHPCPRFALSGKPQ
jgi:hypothetical protein